MMVIGPNMHTMGRLAALAVVVFMGGATLEVLLEEFNWLALGVLVWVGITLLFMLADGNRFVEGTRFEAFLNWLREAMGVVGVVLVFAFTVAIFVIMAFDLM